MSAIRSSFTDVYDNHIMTGASPDPEIVARLHIWKYSREACVSALEGKTLPHALGHPLHRLCIISGIRHHHGFGEELRGTLPIFERALNARSIMSNVIPDLSTSEVTPYCIWHPETGSEDTYQKLWQKYPRLAYQIGRACAVAGYDKLYDELDLLPDVHITEEARECGNLSIYQKIASQPSRYSIMNDYSLSIDLENREPVQLNGDTCARWMLDIKQEFNNANDDFEEENNTIQWTEDSIFLGYAGFSDTMFNITEDMHIAENQSGTLKERSLVRDPNRDDLRLLSEPLPQDLPTVQKDLLILMAAYSGDIDRYIRLRRPRMVDAEQACCCRGVYHNSFFAAWWAKQEDIPYYVEMAVNARFIMNNVLIRASKERFMTPYLIWWPTVAQESTYRQLAKLQPEMYPQILHACIYANYQDLFDELLPKITPDDAQYRDTKDPSRFYFREALEKRLAELGMTEPKQSRIGWSTGLGKEHGHGCNSVHKHLNAQYIHTDWYTPYNGLSLDAEFMEFMVCLPEEWQIAADDERGERDLDYVYWPPSGDPNLVWEHRFSFAPGEKERHRIN